ncbi:MAG: serine hydrolase domain-containing protein [Acidimicrobiales bacterium]
MIDSVQTVALPDGRQVHARLDGGFEPMLATFVENFTDRHDLGAGCSVLIDGAPVFEAWGGIADRRTGRPQSHDTAAVIFSCSKGILAACAYRLLDQGRLDLDLPVAHYWPEFARNGKEHLTVRQVLSHRAGLAALDRDLTRSEVLAWQPVIAAIENQAPLHTPEEGFVYHALTYGWLVGEIIRRVTGELPGAYLRRELTGPLGLRMWIGLPPGAEDLAWMEAPLPDEDSPEARLAAELYSREPVVGRSLSMGGAFDFPADDAGHVTFNDDDIQRAEVPGANGISSAAALARFYAACLGDDATPGLLSREAIEGALVPRSWGTQLTGSPDDGARWGTGFQLASPPSQPMLGPTSFGHAGAGGQLGFADIKSGAAFAYLSNQMGGYGDARAKSLTESLAMCL